MNLALFDLDNTLLAGDSDHAWGTFLVAAGLVDAQQHQANNDRFYEDYLRGRLDIDAFLRFQLAALSRYAKPQLLALRSQFLITQIAPLRLPAASALIEMHRARGDRLMIVTATNRFITEPIAHSFGITELLATTPEEIDGIYTGRYLGIPTFREGKVRALQAWLAEHRMQPQNLWAYSDSHNDLPLLECATHPVAVDPDPTLARFAQQRGWPCLNLRTDIVPRHCAGGYYRLEQPNPAKVG